ncbi:WD40-repeat-containing domain protein [Zychaea mexicana]|uniref:WD40-repeat-containing domain protein n=1 Tax=Zychaea mexicana TaxID=64656 RepID=UPI0022FE62A1|nr:WD40-repeat-containing domain protein [Zychaea mexicana]KAI9499644.1 WD40-repeat-containing domain protein [Zychaea mexicana]
MLMDPNDVEVAHPPSDGVSSMAFSPTNDHLAVASWDHQVRIYGVQSATGSTTPIAAYEHQNPALSVAWCRDGNRVISGGADNTARMYDVIRGQAIQIAQHAAPVKSVKVLGGLGDNVIATASWDQTLKYWDTRSPQPIATVQLPDRCYVMDTVDQLLVVGTAERHVCIFDLKNPTVIYKQTVSPLKWQTRAIACFPDAKGFAIGSIEGRIGIQYVDPRDHAKNFSFRCHRDEKTKQVFAVNDISFHPTFGSFSTCGSDGTTSFWDKDSRQRLKLFSKVQCTVSCTAFNRNGNLLAYAVSYDWSQGYKKAPSPSGTNPNKIGLHAVIGDEAKTKKKR